MPAGAFQQALKSIIDNYADVIEGGNTWRGTGTAYRGIPGRLSNDRGLREGDDTPLTQNAAGSTTTVKIASTYSWDSSRWVKNDTPGFFLLCTSATEAANVNAARRITDWNNTTKTFTVDAFPAATSSGDIFTVLQGFKRIPNQLDILKDDLGGIVGIDRMFHLRALPGAREGWYGDGTQQYRTTLEIYLRMLKFGREHDAEAAALENLSIMRSLLPRGANPDHRDGTYTVALIADEGQQPEKAIDDVSKIIARDSYTLIYRVDTTYN